MTEPLKTEASLLDRLKSQPIDVLTLPSESAQQKLHQTRRAILRRLTRRLQRELSSAPMNSAPLSLFRQGTNTDGPREGLSARNNQLKQ